MRLMVLVALMALLVSGCGRDEGETTSTINAKDRELGKVKSMIIRGGCFGCHDIEENRFGPSWKAVAERYKSEPNASSMLAESVKYGSGGKWGDVVGNNVMPPNEQKVNDAEIAQLVRYILSL